MRAFWKPSLISSSPAMMAPSARHIIKVPCAGGRSGESVSRAYDSGGSRDDGPVSSNAYEEDSPPISRENLDVHDWIPYDIDSASSSLDEFINAERNRGGMSSGSGDNMDGFRGGIVRGSRLKYTDPSGLPLRRCAIHSSTPICVFTILALQRDIPHPVCPSAPRAVHLPCSASPMHDVSCSIGAFGTN